MAYVVIQPGDTLESIAERYGIEVEALKELNPSLKDRFEPGMRLVLAKPSLRVTVQAQTTSSHTASDAKSTEASVLQASGEAPVDRVSEEETPPHARQEPVLQGILPHVFHRPYLFSDPLESTGASDVASDQEVQEAIEKDTQPPAAPEHGTAHLTEQTTPSTNIAKEHRRPAHALDLEYIRLISAQAFIYPQGSPTYRAYHAYHAPSQPVKASTVANVFPSESRSVPMLPGLMPLAAVPWGYPFGMAPMVFYPPRTVEMNHFAPSHPATRPSDAPKNANQKSQADEPPQTEASPTQPSHQPSERPKQQHAVLQIDQWMLETM